MSWTAIASGDAIPSKLDAVIAELKIAIAERETALGLDLGIVWDTSTHIARRASQDMTDLRNGIADLLAGDGDTRFIDAATELPYADIDALLTDAGYPAGWLSLGGLAIAESASAWSQVQDVFSTLVVYRRAVANDDFGVYERRYAASNVGTSEAKNNASWTAAKAATPVPPYPDSNTVAWFRVHDGIFTTWHIKKDSNVNYPISGFIEADMGDFLKVFIPYLVDVTGDMDDNIVVTTNGGFPLIGAAADGSTNGEDSIELTAGFTFGADFPVDFAIFTAEPALPPEHTVFYGECFIGISVPHGHARFLFDIAPALTYG